MAFRRGLTIWGILAGLVPAAWSITDLGPGALLLEVNLRAGYDSNIFLNTNEEEDFLLTTLGTIHYQQDRGVLHLNAQAGLKVGRFLEFRDQNYENFISSISISGLHREESGFGFNLSTGWRQQTAANAESGNRLESEIAHIRGTTSVVLSDRMGIRSTLAYISKTYIQKFYTNSDDATFRLDGLWRYSEKLIFTSGYRYRNIDYEGNGFVDRQSNTLILGAEGDLLPKVTGTVEIGYIWQASDADDTPYYGVALEWFINTKQSLSLTGSRDNFVSSLGENVVNSILLLKFNQTFSNTVTGSISAGYGKYQRYGVVDERVDDIIRAGAGLKVLLGQASSVNLNLSYENRDSTLIYFDFERISGTVGFNFVF